MQDQSRRHFLSGLVKGGAAALLGLIPGTFFGARKAARSGQQDFKSILNSTTKSNVYGVLQKMTLPSEEKLAILAVREADPGEIHKIINFENIKIARGRGCGGRCDSGASREGGTGRGCGRNCSSTGPGTVGTGFVCGNNCKSGPGMGPVIDQSGRLGLAFDQMNFQKIQTAVNDALKIIGR